jgi:hypothetical protein
MKNFSELLATELLINVETVVDHNVSQYCVPLLDPVKIQIHGNLTSFKIDNFDVMPFTWCQNNTWYFELDQPFYQWRHNITGQGWLLQPQ